MPHLSRKPALFLPDSNSSENSSDLKIRFFAEIKVPYGYIQSIQVDIDFFLFFYPPRTIATTNSET